MGLTRTYYIKSSIRIKHIITQNHTRSSLWRSDHQYATTILGIATIKYYWIKSKRNFTLHIDVHGNGNSYILTCFNAILIKEDNFVNMSSFEKSKTTLGLEMATDPRWVNIAEKSIEFILTDHAWCEQKAAVHGISIISKFSKFSQYRLRLFLQSLPKNGDISERWLKSLKSRGFELGHQRKDEYVNRLNNFIRKGDHVHKQIIEYLLSFAMIEARSCERFRLLSIHVQDLQLKKFYHDFMVSEAGHYKAFINLAKEFGSENYVMNRWDEFIEFEAEMVKKIEVRGDRMH